jgi:hypothetical protein
MLLPGWFPHLSPFFLIRQAGPQVRRSNKLGSWPSHHTKQFPQLTPLLRVGLHVVSSACYSTGSTRIYWLDQPCSVNERRVFTEILLLLSLSLRATRVSIRRNRATVNSTAIVTQFLTRPIYSGFVLSPISGPQVYMPESHQLPKHYCLVSSTHLSVSSSSETRRDLRTGFLPTVVTQLVSASRCLTSNIHFRMSW